MKRYRIASLYLFTIFVFVLLSFAIETPPSNLELDQGPDGENHVVYRETDSSNEDYVAASHAEWIYDALLPTQELYLDLDILEPYWTDDDNRYNWIELMESGYASAIPDRIRYNTKRSNNEPYEIEHRRLVVHEMFHHVQYAYLGSNEGWGSWMSEAIPKMMEDKLYDDIDEDTSLRFYSEVDSYLGNPNRRLMDLSYTAAIYWNYLTERFGVSPNAFQQTDIDVHRGVDFIKRLYEDAADADGTDAKEVIDDLVRSIDGDSSFDESWQDFTIANYLKDYTISIPGVPIHPRWYDYYDDDDPTQAYRKVSTTDIGTLNSTGSSYIRDVTEWGARYAEGKVPTNAQIYGVQIDSPEDITMAVMRIDTSSSKAVGLYKTLGKEAKQAYYNNPDEPVDVIAVALAGLDDKADDVEAVFAAGNAKLTINRPNFDDPEYVGEETDPERFIIRLIVQGPSILGSPTVQGLNYEDFEVFVGSEQANVIYGLDVLGEYWLTVRAPVQASAGRYDLTVRLGSIGSSQTLAIDYTVVRRSQMLVADESGSMASSAKLEAAKNAGLLLTSVIPDDDQIGVVGFSDVSNLLLPLSTSNFLTRIFAGLAVWSLDADGSTSIGAGLETAADELKSSGVDGNLHYITLLSDGKENTAPLWSSVKSQLVGEATKVNTIGFGEDADTDMLAEIAWQTDGDFYYVDTGSPTASAKRTHQSLQAILNCLTGLPMFTPILSKRMSSSIRASGQNLEKSIQAALNCPLM